MLGMFLTDSNPAGVPEVVIRYVGRATGLWELDVGKPYGDQQQTPYEHAWEIGICWSTGKDCFGLDRCQARSTPRSSAMPCW